MKTNYFLGFCLVLRSHDGGRRGQEKGVERVVAELRRRADSEVLGWEGSGQEVAACHKREVMDQCT